MFARKLIASLALLFALTLTPTFAQDYNPYVQFQYRNGRVQTMRLHRAERIQSRGEGVIVAPNTSGYYNNVNGYYNNVNGYYNGSYYATPYNTVSPYQNSYSTEDWYYYQDREGNWHRRHR